MKRTESLIRFILGPVRMNILPMVMAVEIIIELVFIIGTPIDDIFVTKDVYPELVMRMKKDYGIILSHAAASRRIERISNQCWEAMVDRNLVKDLIGAALKDIRAPRDMLFYLAFYSYLGTPYYIAVQNRPTMLF